MGPRREEVLRGGPSGSTGRGGQTRECRGRPSFLVAQGLAEGLGSSQAPTSSLGLGEAPALHGTPVFLSLSPLKCPCLCSYLCCASDLPSEQPLPGVSCPLSSAHPPTSRDLPGKPAKALRCGVIAPSSPGTCFALLLPST